MPVEKIVGTQFAFEKIGVKRLEDFMPAKIHPQTYMSDGGVRCLLTSAVLVPEPTNPYDRFAVGVHVRLRDGSVVRIGWLSKQGWLHQLHTQQRLGAYLHNRPVFVVVKAYSEIANISDSYEIVVAERA